MQGINNSYSRCKLHTAVKQYIIMNAVGGSKMNLMTILMKLLYSDAEILYNLGKVVREYRNGGWYSGRGSNAENV